MAHRARQRKPVKTRSPRAPKIDDAKTCASCGRVTKMPTNVVPSIWPDTESPTAWFCSTPCFKSWYAKHRPKKLDAGKATAARAPKNTAPMDPML